MARLPLVDPDDPNADPAATALLRKVRHRMEADAMVWRDINVYRAMANHPDIFASMVAFGNKAYSNNSLTPAQRELAYLGASVANDCHY